MKKIFLKSFFLTVLAFGIFSAFAYVFAQPDLGLEYGAQTGLGTQDIRITVANIIRTALGLLGIVALVIVLWGGFMWMTAGGDENRVATAKKILFNGIVGLAIIMSSWAITSFIISRLVQATVGIYPDHCYNGVVDLDLGETGRDCGGPCPTCPGDTPFNPYGSGNYFKIKSVPLGGQLCVANYHPVITFNYPVNLETVQGKIRILDVQNNPVEGSWTTGGNGQMIVFSATGDCGDNGPSDCFSPNTPFTIDFTGANSNIESVDGKKLVCSPIPSINNCLPIDFITGSGIDRAEPIVFIFDPGTVGQGDSKEIEISAQDDIAVQNVSLYVAGKLVGSQSFDGCQQDVTARIIWNTASLQSGQLYTLVAEGMDQAAQIGRHSRDVRLLPAHCFNNTLDPGEEQIGPPACGGDCGSCSGGACQYDHQCAGGLLCIDSVCTRVMRILGIDPSSGAPKNYMGIFGENFGTTPGTVWFSKVAQPNKDTTAHWTEAQVVTCGTDTKNWFNDQIVVEVPEDFNKDQAGSAIMVSGNGFVVNTIGDGTDIHSRNLRFRYDSALANRPSLCMVNPSQFSSFQNNIRYVGKEFGVYDSNVDRVYLNVSNDIEDKLMMTVNTWGAVSGLSQVQTQAPRLENGSLTTYVLANSVKSNFLRVRVGNTYDTTAPIINTISPREGAKGEFITILGSNFGSSRGSVRFYKKPVTSLANNNQYFEGSFDFMDECLSDLWNDKKIIVKIPKVAGEIGILPDIGNYAVVVFNAKGQNSIIQNSASFDLNNLNPKPGICKIKPASGPVGSGLDVYGENFGNNKDNLKIYFWKNGATASSYTNRASTTPQTLSNIKGGQQLTGLVSADAMSGELIVRRMVGEENLFSNPLSFTVKDCTNPGESCAEGEKCCSGGGEKGVCKPVGELCSGEIRSTGYMWRFTTKTFPKTPKVVERCSRDDSTVPTPAPNVALNKEAENTCLTAEIIVEIDTNINSTTVNSSNFNIYRCNEGPLNLGYNFCKNINNTALSITREVNNNNDTALLTANLSGSGTFTSNTWYQVVLTKDIRSADTERPQNLLASKPCDNFPNSAYCYVFKTGDKDCVLSSVAVHPSDYTTKILETPVLDRKNKNDPDEIAPPFYFTGIGIGDRCIAINMSGYSWSWTAANPTYATVFGSTTKRTSTVSALANTVGSLSNDAARFSASASKGSVAKSGNGGLVVDLSNPVIIDYAPNCMTACPDAAVFARFNPPMSNTFVPGSIKLLKCKDGADCMDTEEVSRNFQFTQSSGFHNVELNLATDLVTNTFYIVQITSGTIFSAGSSTNNAIPGSPFRENFTWRFRTKDSMCEVDRVDVLPKVFNAYSIGAKTIYSSDAYSSPDECNSKGQKLKSSDYNWNWVSLSPQVATATAYKIIGKNPFCTSNCLKRGSTISSGTFAYDYPMCGNGKVEAGEDCDPPNLYSGGNCGMNCLLTNKIKTGSLTADKVDSKDINAPVCGDGKVSPQEDCDLGIRANATQSSSSMFCSKDCLHVGTRLTSDWCGSSSVYTFYHTQQTGQPGETSASFTLRKKEFENNCALAISQCGNGVIEPDEDCEGGSNCNSSCLFINKTKTGSSLFTNPRSVCGDGVPASNEDAYCETQLFGNNNFISPWALVTAVGESFQAEIPKQTSQIRATLTAKNKSAFGEFNLVCGYTTDGECQAVTGNNGYGVGANSCCYQKLAVSSTYPENGNINICPNTEIKISFDNPINPATLPGNLLIAKNYGTSDSSFCTGTQIIAGNYLDSSNNDHLPWYKKIWKMAVGFVQKVLGVEKAIAQWCTGETIGTSKVVYNITKNTFDIVVDLEKPLTGSTTAYRILLSNGIKDEKGVGIIPYEFTFTTWGEADVCKIGSVNIVPNKVEFTEANSSTLLTATVRPVTDSAQNIQPTDSYSWDYIWSKDRSGSFTVGSVTTGSITFVTSTNQNGEGEVYVTVSSTDQKDNRPTSKSKITVLICENPWPPFETSGQNIWPFEDKEGNKDYFDFSYNPEITKTGFTGSNNTQGPFTNFSTYYCADAGATGTKDDLPYLKPVVSTTAETNLLKYYFLTSDKNADAIGIKVFRNPDYFTLAEWLNYNTSTRRGNYNFLKIDGYEAAVDGTGNNVYVAALNYSLETDQKVYSNIYSFNLSVYPDSQTKQVFDQILTNLKFNINLPEENNLKLCAAGYDWISGSDFPSENCNTDLDCLGVAGKPICLNQKEKMQRNYQRVQDARFVSTSLASYYILNSSKYPSITQSYLPNRAMSIWQSSWVELGNKLRQPLPLDPINKLAPAGTCYMGSTIFCTTNSQCGATPGSTGQVGYWAGENNFKDSSVRENDAQGQGVSFAPGVGRDFAFNFPTGFEKMTIKHQDDYDIDLNNFAISFWFKPTEKTPAVLIKKGGWSDAASNNTLGGFMVEYNKLSFAGVSPVANNGTIRFAIFPSSTDPLASNQYFAIDTDSPLALNKWHHVLIRYHNNLSFDPVNHPSDSMGYMYLVVDGEKYSIIKSGTSSPRSINTNGVLNLKIGQNTEDIIVGEGLKGQMDEIYLYTDAGVEFDVSVFNKKFENICHLHDSVTGWSAEGLRLSFACADKSMAYNYRLKDNGDYVIRGTEESDNLISGAWLPVWNMFGFDINKFILTSFCEDAIISSASGLCGNGVVNAGETCDFAGERYSGYENCSVNSSGGYTGNMTKTVCNNCTSVSASSVTCATVAAKLKTSCGDGKVQTEFGEICDDGGNNGKLGFCGIDCKMSVALSGSVCGDGVVGEEELCDWNQECDDGMCVIDEQLRVKWGRSKEYSCNYDCKSYGPYCGDNKFTPEYEDCDEDESCNIPIPGNCYIEKDRICFTDDDCANIDFGEKNTLLGRWDAERSYEDTSGNSINTTQRGNVSFGPGLGYGQSFSFNGQENTYLEIASSTSYLNGSFNVSFWFKPTARTEAVLVKQGGWTDDGNLKHSLGGFMIEYNKPYFDNEGITQDGNGSIRFALFPNSNDDWYYALDSKTPLELNQWHHIVARYYASERAMNLYVNGQLVANTNHGTNFIRVGAPSSTLDNKHPRATIQYPPGPGEEDKRTCSAAEPGNDNKCYLPAGLGTTNENIIVGQGLTGFMDKIQFYRPAQYVEVERLYRHVCEIEPQTIAGVKKCTNCSFDNTIKENPPLGLVSYWNFNNPSSNCSIVNGARICIYDKNYSDILLSGNKAECSGFPGVLDCPTEKTEFNLSNKSLLFPFYSPSPGGLLLGTESVLKVNHSDDIKKKLIGDEISVEVWIKPTSLGNTASGVGKILEKGGWDSTKNGSVLRGGYAIEFNSTHLSEGGEPNRIRWAIWSTDSNSFTYLDTRPLSNSDLNKWHHVVGTYRKLPWGTASEMKLYLNGKLEKITTSTGNGKSTGVLMGMTEYPFCIGANCKWDGSSYAATGSSKFPGWIDDIYFYKRVLTNKEITDNYNNKRSGGSCVAVGPASDPGQQIGSCGDGTLTDDEIEKGHECDDGSFNGFKCKIPEGFTWCSWCSSNCRVMVNECPNGFMANQSGICTIQVFRFDREPIPGL